MHSLLKKATRQHTKDHNSRLVLQTIYDGGQMSRADLARLTHLTRTTVSEVVGELIEQGLVEEVGHGRSAVGRTPTLLSVVDDSRHVIAVNITNAELQGAVVTLRGVIRHRARLPLHGQDGSAVLVQLFSFIDSLVKATDRPVLGIGISTPGLIDTTSGIVRRAVNFGWQDLLLRNIVQSHFNLPIYVANDSHMVALAEYMFGQPQNSANLVVIKVGQGIGAGIVLNGQLFLGDDYGAGEIGHVVVVEDGPLCKCGNHGCLEAVASVACIVRRAQEIAEVVTTSPLSQFAAEGRTIDLEAVIQAFGAGDPAARRLIEEVGRYLGAAVANLVGVLNVRRVVITGRVAPFGSALNESIRHELRRRVLPALAEATEVEVLAQGPDAVLLGTSALLLTNELGLTRLVRRDARAEEMVLYVHFHPKVGEDYHMSGSKQPVWLIVAVALGLAVVAYLALRPQPSVLPAPASARPAAVSQVVPTAVEPAPSTSSGQGAAILAPANVPAVFGPQLLTSTSGPEDWAMEGNNPSRTRSTLAQLALPLTQQSEVKLTADTGDGSPPTIARGTMLVESEHLLRAFDLRDDTQRWSFPLRGIYVSPAVAGKYVFIRSESDNQGQMLALDMDSGKTLWAFTPKRLSSASNGYYGGHLTSPVVVDGTVFVGAGKEVYALDAASGAVRWEFAAKEYISSSATAADGRIYISDFDAFYAIDQKTGSQIWSHPTTTTFYFAPVIGGQTVLLSSGAQLVALDAVSGQQRWTTSLPGEEVIPSAVQGSRAFVKSTSTLYALDLATGKQLWQAHDTNYLSLPAVAGDQVFLISGMGAGTALLALDASTGRSTWTLPVKSLSTTAPVIAGQSLYVRTTDGRVLGFWH